MHLLIDIRSSSWSYNSSLSYAQSWVKFWKRFHPDDIISWLLYEDEHIDEENIVFIPRNSFWRSKKKLSFHQNGPDRILSFSLCEMIDHSPKTILHISDISDFLYPRVNLNWFEKKKKEYNYKKILRKAHKIIVPHFDIGRELSEVFGASEEKMNVIPYLTEEIKKETDIAIFNQYNLHPPYFFTEWTAGEEWNPLGLLKAYSSYVHDFEGETKLIIHGNLGENLGYISSSIRALDLIDMVKIIGILPQKHKKIILGNALGWIFIGPYYSAGPQIVEGEGFHIPLILPDIGVLSEYRGIHIHPNHLETLPEILKNLKKGRKTGNEKDNEWIMNVYTKIIAE